MSIELPQSATYLLLKDVDAETTSIIQKLQGFIARGDKPDPQGVLLNWKEEIDQKVGEYEEKSRAPENEAVKHLLAERKKQLETFSEELGALNPTKDVEAYKELLRLLKTSQEGVQKGIRKEIQQVETYLSETKGEKTALIPEPKIALGRPLEKEILSAADLKTHVDTIYSALKGGNIEHQLKAQTFLYRSKGRALFAQVFKALNEGKELRLKVEDAQALFRGVAFDPEAKGKSRR